MKILRLQAENVKRISVVDIKPNGAVIELSGKNGNGKTSVLDSILWALGGTKPIQMMPIKKGATQAHAIVDLGDDVSGLKLRVTRTFTRSGDDGSEFTTKLKVETPDGMKGGQDILNAIVGRLSFDPMEFQRAKPGERLAYLKSIVPDFDFDAAAKARKETFDSRTDINREVARLEALLKTMPADAEDPGDPIDIASVVAQLDQLRKEQRLAEDGIRDHDARIGGQRLRLGASAELVRARKEDVYLAEQRLEAAREALRVVEDQHGKDMEELEAMLELPTPTPFDDSGIAALQDKIANAAEINDRVAAAKARAKTAADLDAKKAEADKMTADIGAQDERVRQAVENAKLPVRGLSLGTDDVMLNGVPFDQASDAEQLRTSTAIAMAMNPKLRVIRIRNGGLLDEDAFQILKEVATEDDYQIWLESVFPHDAGAALIMEDGHVRE